MNYPWLPAFKIKDLEDGWDEAPATAGIYVISCGTPIQRLGSIDQAGIIYIGQSLCLRDRLWAYWYAQHEASGMLWDLPEVAGAIIGRRLRSSKSVDPFLGN